MNKSKINYKHANTNSSSVTKLLLGCAYCVLVVTLMVPYFARIDVVNSPYSDILIPLAIVTGVVSVVAIVKLRRGLLVAAFVCLILSILSVLYAVYLQSWRGFTLF